MENIDGQATRELFLQLLRTRMALRRAMQRMLRKHNAGISFEMLQVINRLHDHPGMSQQELAVIMSKSKACVSNIIANLERRSLLRREEDSEDRRNKKVFLTQEGMEFHSRLAPMTAEVYSFAEERLGTENAEEVRLTLKKLYGILETY